MMQSIRSLFNDARQLPLAAAVAAAVLTAPAALAADWQPTKPVEIVVAAGAGGASGLVVAWWGYPVLSLLTCLLPASVGVAAYVAARHTAVPVSSSLS